MPFGTPAYAAFFTVYTTALTVVELLAGALFVVRASAESSRRLALLACAYAWAAPLAIVNVIAIPGLWGNPAGGAMQIAPAIWILWHCGWAIALAVYAFSDDGPRGATGRLVPFAFAGALTAATVTFAAAARLPILVGTDGRFLASYLAGIAIPLAVEGIAAARLLARPRGTRDTWVAVALVLAVLEAVLQLTAGVRFAAPYFFSRVAGLLGAVAILAAIGYDLLSLSRKNVLAAAEAQQLEDFRLIADAMPQIVWQLGADGRNLYANLKWSEYSGRERRDGRDEGFFDAIHPDDRALRTQAFAEARARGTTYEATYRLRAADGSYRYFLSRAISLRRRGKITAWIGTSTDIDEQKRSEAQQREAYERESRDAERLRTLAEIGRALSQSLDLDVVLQTAVQSPIPSLGDWAILNTFDADGVLVVQAVHHRQPGLASAMQRLVGRPCVIAGSRGGSAEVAIGERGITTIDIDDERLERMIRPEWLEFILSLQPRSSIVVPLVVAGRVRGTLNLVYANSGRRYADDDRVLFEEIGRRIALAIDNAERYAREHRVADRLQRASLPGSLPVLAGAKLDAVYQAGNDEAQIGGDWYDAFLLDDGRLVAGVGDVMGSGLEAAVTMNAVRQSIRGAAEVFPDPVTILNAVDRALAKSQPERIVTAFLAIIDVTAGSVLWASAGHPPPFVRWGEGRVERLDGSGLPLGLRGERNENAESATLSLTADALLVLYTDGLTEANRNAEEGERRLAAVLGEIDCDDRPAEHIRSGVLDPALRAARDDIAILTVRLTPERNTRIRHLTFDARRIDEVVRIRRDLVDAIAAWGMDAPALADAELVLGELLGNVARHAPGLAEVILDLTGGAPRVRIADRGTSATPNVRMPAPDAESGRGLYIVSQLVDEMTISVLPGGGSEVSVTLRTRRASAPAKIERFAT